MIRLVAVCFGLLLLLSACNVPQESKAEKTVVRKKIAVSPAQPQRFLKPSAHQKENSVNSQSKKLATAPIKTSPPSQKAKSVKQEKPPVAALSVPEEETNLEDVSTPLYDPKGKIDPFASLLKNKAAVAKKKKIKKRIPRTPLEKMDISQIKLVAVIRAPEGNTALVEEASGKGYIVSIGTYVGMNGGRIKRILKDRLIIEEETENILGKVSVQKTELKLQKSPGEF